MPIAQINDDWMDRLEVERGVVLCIQDEPWLDWVFGDGGDRPQTIPDPRPIGALELWQAQCRAKIRPALALEAAACQELNALDALRDRNPWAAEAWFNAAANTITRAAEEKARRRKMQRAA